MTFDLINTAAGAESTEPNGSKDPFTGSAEDVAAEETIKKVELFEWADSVLGLDEAELEFALESAAQRFKMKRASLKRIINARRAAKAKAQAKAQSSRGNPHNDNNVKYYGTDFKVSDGGVFARKVDDNGHFDWEQICTTRIDLEALTRDVRAENWGTYIVITNRDGGKKNLAVPHSLTAADRVADIAGLLASLGVGIVPSKKARQLLVQFLTVEVSRRITAVPQIGWHYSAGSWVFVLPDKTIVPATFKGPEPVLQTESLHLQHGIEVRGTVEEWVDHIIRPMAGNSNVYLCVGTMFAGPLLKFAHEPPGFFHLWGTSKIAKSLVGAIGQSVYGRPKVPGEADAFGASWIATAVGLERYAVLRSDVGAYLDEISEGSPKTIRPAVYGLANGSTKLRGTQDITLRPMESFRILGISTGEPTMEGYLSSGGEKVPAGLKVRLVDVPAEVQPDSAFETCPREQIEELGKRFYPLTMKLHGAVGQSWLQHLVELGEEKIAVLLHRHREEWLGAPAVAAVRSKASVQVHTILNRFALVAAALRMGVEAKLLPWAIDDIDCGVAACMARCLTNRNGRLDLAGEILGAVEQIRTILAANLHGRFIHLRINSSDGKLEHASPSDVTKRDTLGYVKDGRILVEPTAWRSVLCAGYDPTKTAQHLSTEKLLFPDEAGRMSRKEKILQGQTPESRRFYVLDQKILEDLAATLAQDATS
jgi:putative DNA primase/helicase